MNKDLAYGLNPRTATKAPSARKRKGLSGFDSDSSSSTKEPTTGRQSTNAAIAAEQAALRQKQKGRTQKGKRGQVVQIHFPSIGIIEATYTRTRNRLRKENCQRASEGRRSDAT
jgi:hypothetical protein